jgi:uncharacterized metal-binding protein
METKPKPKATCQCGKGEKIVFTCSGAADVGYIADEVARTLARNRIRKMNCLALVATAEEKVINNVRKSNILVIDGCSLDCGRKVMANAGITDYKYIRVTDLGYEKGKTPTNEETVEAISKELESL